MPEWKPKFLSKKVWSYYLECEQLRQSEERYMQEHPQAPRNPVRVASNGHACIKLIKSLRQDEAFFYYFWSYVAGLCSTFCGHRFSQYFCYSWNRSETPEAYALTTFDLRVMLFFVVIPRGEISGERFSVDQITNAKRIKVLMGDANCFLLTQDFYVILSEGGVSEHMPMSIGLADDIDQYIEPNPDYSVRPCNQNCKDLTHVLRMWM